MKRGTLGPVAYLLLSIMALLAIAAVLFVLRDKIWDILGSIRGGLP